MLRGQVVKQMKRIIAMAALLCVTLVNAEVLRAVHVYQYSIPCDASDSLPPGGRPHPTHHHDPSKCTFCIQLASAKAVPLTFAEHISFVGSPAEELICYESFFPPRICLSSLSPRAPPLICS